MWQPVLVASIVKRMRSLEFVFPPSVTGGLPAMYDPDRPEPRAIVFGSLPGAIESFAVGAGAHSTFPIWSASMMQTPLPEKITDPRLKTQPWLSGSMLNVTGP